MLDTVGCVTYANDGLLAATGWTRTEILGVDWFDAFVPAEERDSRRQLLHQGMLHGFPPYPSTSVVLARDGSPRHLAISTSVLHDASGRVTGVAAIGGDMTQLQNVSLERDRLGAA